MFCRLGNIAFHFHLTKAAAWESYFSSGLVVLHSASFKPSFHTACWGVFHFATAVQVLPPFLLFIHPRALRLNTNAAGQHFDWQAVRPWPSVMGRYAPVQLQDPARPEPPIPWLAAFVLTLWKTALHGRKGFCFMALRSPEDMEKTRQK